MSTIFTFDQELPELVTPAATDLLLVKDVSTGLKKDVTVTAVEGVIDTVALGAAATSTIGFYGVTAVNQGTMTATALSAIGTTTISAGNSSGVWGWASSTEALAFVTRVTQMQANLETFMARVSSTGLVAVDGV
jgi:hypothetical protein